MTIPLQITFKNIEASDAVEARIHKKVEELEKFVSNIMRCRVIIEAPHKHHYKGNIYSIKVDLTLPGDEIVTSRNPGQDHAHEDIYVAIRDAFKATRRQLEDYIRKRRNKVKTHAALPHGYVKEIFPMEDYGVITTSDNRDIYFHRNSLLDMDFENIHEGDAVHFKEEMGEKGPQASTVHVEGKHHVVSK